MSARLGIVIVSYGHGDDVQKLVKLLSSQKKSNDVIAVVDNHPKLDTYELLKNEKGVICLKSENLGFGHGCNVAAKKILPSVDALLFVNPDAVPKNNALNLLREIDYSRYAAVMPRILLPTGKINSDGNTLHTTGLSWCDDLYKKPDKSSSVKEVSAVSGAFLAISKQWWKKLGGFDTNYFMYYEDVDLSTRIKLLGGKQAVITEAEVVHDYDFKKGDHKWLYLERNHPLYIIKNWPLAVIIALVIQNTIVFIGLWLMAIVEGRLDLKFKSSWKSLIALPEFIKARRDVQKNRVVSSYEFLQALNPTVDNQAIGSFFNSKFVNTFFRVNFLLASSLLKLTRR